MALDQVRTQVLLLHSEQSTLDSLSAGFDDRYTVHCATSGTEALITLGDTPIHVIVSAKDLPGMSGVEALREAKKRSPDTLGILLADAQDTDIEAIVGDKEIFQVIKGGVDAGRVRQLVDDATQRMRLLALADSANDRAANPDEPAEHIVMETSENGSSIISDGTGRFPALDRAGVGAGISAGARGVDVLVLTRDEDFFRTVTESTRGLHEVHRANTLPEAEKALAKNRVGVAVVDAAMVGGKVEKLTQHLGQKSARLVNIIAGRRDDGEMLMDLINRGKVYRFLLKPVSPGRARLAIEASVKHHLEAPDTAFKASGGSAAAQPASAAAPKTVGRKPATAGSAADRKLPDPGDGVLDDPLTDAFDGDDSSFTQTMTGIVTNLGKALTKIKDAKEAAKETAEMRPERKSPTLDAPAPKPRKPVDRPHPAPTPARPTARPTARPKTESAAPAQERGAPGSFDIDTAHSDDGGRGLFRNPLLLGGAVLAVIGIGVAFWLFSGSETTAPPGGSVAEDRAPLLEDGFGSSTLEPSGLEAPRTASDMEPGELLEQARLAQADGRIYSPDGANAIELFVAAADAEPDAAEIAAELEVAIEQALGMAETAMLESRTEDAAAALARVEYADPANDRLPFLNAQLAQTRLRNSVEAARAAIRESRFEDAELALAAARELDLGNTSEIAMVEAELAEAQSEQQADELLRLAAERLDDGTLIAPANDNARYYYQRVLAAEPDNLVALQGLQTVASKLVLQARAQIDAQRFDSAGEILDEARRLDPGSAELASAAEALASGREQVAAQRRAEQNRVAAEQQAAEQERIAAERRAEQQRLAAAQQAAPAAGARESGTASAGAATNDDSAAAGNAGRPEPGGSLVAISDLTRTRYVAPKYPRAAERRNLSGWVDVVFTVKADGTTADIEVRDSEPSDIFVNAALRAVERWEFEPIVEEGTPVEKQTGVRLMFALE